jgi:imidazolonepropionase-like amidohydrolase
MKTLIKNAEIVTMTGEKYKNGCILFDEKIQYVGEDKAFEADKIIDAEGKIVMPGLIVMSECLKIRLALRVMTVTRTVTR